MMSLPFWLSGSMFLPEGLCPWSHVPSRGSLYLVPCSFQGVSVQGDLSLGDGVSVEGG